MQSAAPIFSRLQALSTPPHLRYHSFAGLGVYEAEGFRWIASIDGAAQAAIQSAMCIATPHDLVLPNHRAMGLLTLLMPTAASVLDLGLGGAALARHFAAYLPEAGLVAVERAPAMLEIARQFFHLPKAQRVVVGDAVTFVRRNKTPADLIVVDLFDGRLAPRALLQSDFYQCLGQCLVTEGACAVNLLPGSEAELSAILAAARRVFVGSAIMQFSEVGNLVLFLQKKPLPDRSVLRRRLAASRYSRQQDLEGAIDRLHYLPASMSN